MTTVSGSFVHAEGSSAAIHVGAYGSQIDFTYSGRTAATVILEWAEPSELGWNSFGRFHDSGGTFHYRAKPGIHVRCRALEVGGAETIVYSFNDVAVVTEERVDLDGNKIREVTQGTGTDVGSGLKIDGSSVTASGAPIAPTDATAATLVLTAVQNETILLDRAAGSAITLPAATGSGVRKKFIIKTPTTGGNNVTISTSPNTDIFIGVAFGSNEAGTANVLWLPGATDNTITFNHGTTGGKYAGEWLEVQDVAAGKWMVSSVIINQATPATPFSHV